MAIQLDDDELVLRTWALAARQAGVKLTQFHDPSLFLAALLTAPRDAEVFVDARLGAGVRGEDIARKAFDLGFTRVFLATGLPREAFPGLTWLAGVVGKDPPWLA